MFRLFTSLEKKDRIAFICYWIIFTLVLIVGFTINNPWEQNPDEIPFIGFVIINVCLFAVVFLILFVGYVSIFRKEDFELKTKINIGKDK